MNSDHWPQPKMKVYGGEISKQLNGFDYSMDQYYIETFRTWGVVQLWTCIWHRTQLFSSIFYKFSSIWSIEYPHHVMSNEYILHEIPEYEEFIQFPWVLPPTKYDHSSETIRGLLAYNKYIGMGIYLHFNVTSEQLQIHEWCSFITIVPYMTRHEYQRNGRFNIPLPLYIDNLWFYTQWIASLYKEIP